MKKILVLNMLVLLHSTTYSQLGVEYDATIQATTNLQYFKPKGDLFVCDCIPFKRQKF